MSHFNGWYRYVERENIVAIDVKGRSEAVEPVEQMKWRNPRHRETRSPCHRETRVENETLGLASRGCSHDIFVR